MSGNRKKTGSRILYVLLLAAFGFQTPSFASVFKLKGDNQVSVNNHKIRIAYENLASSQILYSELSVSNSKSFKNLDLHLNEQVLANESKILANSQVNQIPSKSIAQESPEAEELIADISLDIFTGKKTEDGNKEDEQSIALDVIRTVSLFFFLLFFLPLGIFYPLFLVYRKLLDVDEDINPLEDEIFEDSLPIVPPLEDFEQELYSEQATISKLQVAFLPRIVNLKKQLEQAHLNINQRNEHKELDLLRSAISILITQQHWTHASYESESFPLVQAQEKFDMILSTERSKCTSKKLSFVNSGKQQQKTERDTAQNTDEYTVVTMLFNTVGNNVLCDEPINSKETLAQLLINLSQLDEDDLLDFKLIWNPLQENEFITNDQLLMHYEDMFRLF